MMNRRKLFSFLASTPVAAVIGAKAAMDANGNDVAPLMRGDFPFEREWWLNYQLKFERSSNELLRRLLRQQHADNSRSQRFRS